MSLQSLISGSECALPNNPLAQVLKHTDGDRSVQRDRIAGPSSSRLQHLPSSSSHAASQGDLATARQFFDGHTPQSSLNGGLNQMHDITRALRTLDIERSSPANGMTLQEAWSRNNLGMHGPPPTNAALTGSQTTANWSSEFNTKGHSLQAYIPQKIAPQSNSMQTGNLYPASYYRPQYGFNTMNGNTAFTPNLNVANGKGKAREDAFEAAFAQFSTAPQNGLSSARIEEITDETQNAASVLNSTLTEQETDSKTFNDIEHQMRQLIDAQKEEIGFDYGASMQEAWENGMGMYEDGNEIESMKFDKEGVPILDAYSFEKDNKYMLQDRSDCLAQAKQLLESNGSLTEVALLLEAAILKGQFGEGGYEAWILLGDTRCMDEREEAGMRALTEGARLAEATGAKGVGLLSLATAFANEGYERGSHAMLLRWLSARFPQHTLSPEDTAATLRMSHWASRERVTEAFLSVAREQHAQGALDPDVQSGLGVLFYISGDFTRAQDCFSAALSARPRDFMLWNRFGSSLSNGNKPEDALGAYREALQLRPTYTRAIYNVGVACLNIGATKEAAEHFLSALSMQDSSAGEQSQQLWFTLRRTLETMGRDDLVDKARSGGDVASFRAEGFDF